MADIKLADVPSELYVHVLYFWFLTEKPAKKCNNLVFFLSLELSGIKQELVTFH